MSGRRDSLPDNPSLCIHTTTVQEGTSDNSDLAGYSRVFIFLGLAFESARRCFREEVRRTRRRRGGREGGEGGGGGEEKMEEEGGGGEGEEKMEEEDEEEEKKGKMVRPDS